MKIMWDKLLVEKHTIVCFQHSTIPQRFYYLFPDEIAAHRYVDKLKQDSEVMQSSILVKSMKDIFPE